MQVTKKYNENLFEDRKVQLNTGNWMWVSSSAFEKLLDSSKCAIVPLGQR